MNISADPDAIADGDPSQSRPHSLIWHHAAFCGLALPLRHDGQPFWERAAPSASISVGNAAAAEAAAPTLPSGRYLRLLLIHLFTTALHTGTPNIGLGENPSSLAAAMALELDAAALAEFTEQCAMLATTRIAVAMDGGAALSVFDARGRPRGTAPEWRPVLRLNGRFLEQLSAHAVRLDRRIVAALGDHLPTLDAYAWIAATLPPPGEPERMTGWAELAARFAEPDATPADHRAGFERCLQRVSAAWPAIRLLIGEDGVAVGHSERDNPVTRPPAAEVVSATPPESPVATAPPEPVVVAPPPPAPENLAPPPPRQSEVDDAPRRVRDSRIAVKSHLTGLHQVLWLQRDGSGDEVVIEVTPGGRYDPQNVTVLALEPIIVQISGGLYTREFERVSAWVNANRDLIDDVWYNDVGADDEVLGRVKKVPPPGWR